MSLRRFASNMAFGGFVIVCCVVGIAVVREFIAEGRVPEVSASASEAKAMEALPQVPRVRPADLIRAYEANEIRADLQYKGKVVEIVGQVENIGTAVFGGPYVTLKHTDGISFTSVMCTFPKNDLEQLARLNSGEGIVLRGRVSGKLMGVMVTDCSIVQRGAAQ